MSQFIFELIGDGGSLFSADEVSNVCAMNCKVDVQSLMVGVGLYLTVFQDGGFPF